MGIGAILAENQRLRREMEALVAQKDALLAEKNAVVVELNQKVALLVEENNQLTRRMELMLLKANDRRNQRYEDDKTLPLPFGPAEITPPPRLPEPEEEPQKEPEAKPNKKGGKPPKRRNLGENKELEHEQVRCTVSSEANCKKCGGPLKVLGVDRSYRLEWVPGYFKILDVERERCVCPDCPSEGVMVAPAPDFALPKAMCGNGLLSSVLVDKFADRIPLNLQAEWSRQRTAFVTVRLNF